MASFLEKILRTGDKRVLRQLEAYTKAVNSLEDSFASMTDEELRAETDKFRERVKDGESLDILLPEAFAVVREASKRTLGKRHYDVQLMGGAALHLGNIAEMKTGEGKTLVATLPAYLNALSGKGVHIVTVNDYLAEYQANLMGRVFRFLGMECGVILSSMERIETISNAMELRGFGKKAKRTWYSSRSFSKADILCMVSAALLLVLSFTLTFLNGGRYFNPFH